MHVNARQIAASLEKPRERPVALSLNADEDGAPRLDPVAPPHRHSADPRDAAHYAGSVLRVEAGVTAQAANVLGAMHTGGAAVILLDDEYLLLFQIVEQAHVVGCDKELCAVALVALRDRNQRSISPSDVYVKVTVDLVENG